MSYLKKLRQQNEEASRERLKEALEALQKRKSNHSTQPPAPIPDPWKGTHREEGEHPSERAKP